MTRAHLIALVLLGCSHAAHAVDPDAALAVRIPRECAAESSCEALEMAAIERLNSCKQGFNDCPSAAANLDSIRRELAQLRAQRATEPPALPYATASAPPQRNDEVATRVPPEIERSMKADERDSLIRDARAEEMSEAGPEAREKRVRECLHNRGYAKCEELLTMAIEAAATKSEADKLRSLGKASAAQR